MDANDVIREARWEAEQYAARLERTNKRAFILNVILILILLATNIGWLYYESQFTDEKVVIEAEQKADKDSSNYIIGGDYGGKSESQDH